MVYRFGVLTRLISHTLILLVSFWCALALAQPQSTAHASASSALPSPEALRQLPPDGGEKYNRLVFESSPYLQQHATNPIDWYPWGEEALARARREDKPIFLSIGYSTCHWCHVMERESYADPEVGRLMNQFFVAIKVDREERPDLDHIYMNVCHRMARSCGWPLNVILTPDQKPFFVGTYFPREDRQGRPGMLRLLPSIDKVWRTRRQDVLNLSDRVFASLKDGSHDGQGKALDIAALHSTYEQLARLYDATNGGIGGPPKFPKPLSLAFLLRYWKRTGKPKALEMVETTLQAMRRGGIYDHIGLGFHRYATDARWVVPHFEKMLYNQALLLMLYTETYQATGKALYAQTAREIVTYVLRDMTDPAGGFYSAEDADSEGEEGVFYFWTAQEIQHILGKDDAAIFSQVFNISPAGNFREGESKRHNIPHLTKDLALLASQLPLTEAELRQRLETARQRLFDVREGRIHPFKDDKVLTDWNGLMIAGLARAGQVLDEPSYITAARRAADFVLQHLRDDQGRLLKRYRAGQAGLPAHVDDYAYLIWGLLDLYEASFEVAYLQAAIDLQHIMLQYFWDDQQAGFFFTASDAKQLLLRSKDIQDMALPSGNSVAVLNLLRLERMTANTLFASKASELLQAFSGQVSQYPHAHTLLMSAVDFTLGPSFEVVISGAAKREDTRVMLRALRQ
ncbi:MAG: thioredoxin domain-containing protein, partial [Candidatus Tectomicrobia bacterium]